GFFGLCEPTDRPAKTMRMGLPELGFSYAPDPSISRNLTRFLARAKLAKSKELPVQLKGKAFVHPTAILFNGGVMKAEMLCERIGKLLNSWLKEEGHEHTRPL